MRTDLKTSIQKNFSGLFFSFAAFVAVAAPVELSAEKANQHWQELLTSLDPAAIGDDYAAALKKGDCTAAIRAIARYYRNRPATPRYANAGKGDVRLDRADRGVRGEVEIVNIPWHFKDGRIDFLFDPTALQGPRNHEWVWQLNRTDFWSHMAKAYAKTGDAKYAKAFDRQLRDWVAQTDLPPRWNDPGSAWRTIECGLRLMGSWQWAFEVFRKAPDFSDEDLCLMLASMHRQAAHLMAHKTRANWLMMEMNGAYTFATVFPEFKDSAANRREAAAVLSGALREQILPDGLHDELSPDYHEVTYTCASEMLRLAKLYGRTAELPPDFAPLLERAAEAYLALTTPRLTQPRTNDCYTINTRILMNIASQLFPHRTDFLWAASGRREGEAPQGTTASRFLPYAGFAAMRSSWGPEAVYLCFDVGPLGTNHQHQDMLNIQLYCGAEELIFDDGGGQYEISAMRQYGTSGADHNTVLVDGKSQNRREPRKMSAPIDAGWITSPQFDYAQGIYEGEFGPDREKLASHRREVRFFKPDFFCVVDTLRSRDGQAHDYELLFQLDTTKTVAIDAIPGAICSDSGHEFEVLLIPLDGEHLQITTATGAEKPRIAGWYVGRNDRKLHPATTVFMKRAATQDADFATLLVPVRRGEALPVLKKLDGGRFEVTFRGKVTVVEPARLNSCR